MTIKSGKLPSNFLPGRAFCSKPQDALSTGGQYFLTLSLMQYQHPSGSDSWYSNAVLESTMAN